MSPRWERVPAPPPVTGAKLFLDEVLRPQRSLSLTAFRLMMIVVIVFNLAFGAIVIAMGYFPVAGFLGLDVLALWIAFRVNYRAARVEERVQVEVERIHIERRAPDGGAVHWVASPLWARAAIEDIGVSIRTGGRALRVGAFLAPAERAKFASALDDALWRAKRGG